MRQTAERQNMYLFGNQMRFGRYFVMHFHYKFIRYMAKLLSNISNSREMFLLT